MYERFNNVMIYLVLRGNFGPSHTLTRGMEGTASLFWLSTWTRMLNYIASTTCGMRVTTIPHLKGKLLIKMET